MIADVVVVLDEGVNLPFEIAGQVVVVEQNGAFSGIMKVSFQAARSIG
jgi:hypothetical protein